MPVDHVVNFHCFVRSSYHDHPLHVSVSERKRSIILLTGDMIILSLQRLSLVAYGHIVLPCIMLTGINAAIEKTPCSNNIFSI